MQKLRLPINDCKATASFKNKAYASYYNTPHYGVDLISTKGAADRRVWASGNGTVVSAGWDYNAGYTVIITYPKAYNHRTRRYNDIVLRYFHLNSIRPNIKKGIKVTADTLLGYYGGSGFGLMNQWAKHLHMEADTDTKYPNYSATFRGSTAIIKGRASGANSVTTVNPLDYLHSKSTIPDKQSYTTTKSKYINNGDYIIPAP